ncbi:MAG: cytochrome c [Bradymonadaceae bacterium]|nr:cytochrome c [Lujinxingiaceae bacterium]
MNVLRSLLALAAIALSSGCHPSQSPELGPKAPAPQAEAVEYRWLPDGDAQKFKAIEDQLGGFSETMREVAYRYSELYWAGTDENWAYADYQLEHIAEAIEAGIIRRPARADSARPFLDKNIPALEAAIKAQDSAAFARQFAGLQQACNTCHVAEEVAFIAVQTPSVRWVPVGNAP